MQSIRHWITLVEASLIEDAGAMRQYDALIMKVFSLFAFPLAKITHYAKDEQGSQELKAMVGHIQNVFGRPLRDVLGNKTIYANQQNIRPILNTIRDTLAFTSSRIERYMRDDVVIQDGSNLKEWWRTQIAEAQTMYKQTIQAMISGKDSSGAPVGR